MYYAVIIYSFTTANQISLNLNRKNEITTLNTKGVKVRIKTGRNNWNSVRYYITSHAIPRLNTSFYRESTKTLFVIYSDTNLTANLSLVYTLVKFISFKFNTNATISKYDE